MIIFSAPPSRRLVAGRLPGCGVIGTGIIGRRATGR